MAEKNSVVFPLVSIIIRSMDRSTLAEALDSVALQTYPNIEIVIVNAKGADHREVGERCGSFPVRMVGNNEPLDRSRAANVGLDNAIGQYLIFLDDDDLFYPEHIAVLVNALQTQHYSRCAYTGVRVEHYNEGILGTTDLFARPNRFPLGKVNAFCFTNKNLIRLQSKPGMAIISITGCNAVDVNKVCVLCYLYPEIPVFVYRQSFIKPA